MKFLFTVLLTFFGASLLLAQQRVMMPANSNPRGVGNQFQIYQPFSLNTAYSENVPQHYLFLVDDEVQQVLFNPARGAGLNQSFVTANIRSGNSNNVSTAVMLPAKAGKWFISVGGNVSASKNELNEEDFDKTLDITESAESVRERLREDRSWDKRFSNYSSNQAEFRLLKVLERRSGEGTALGVFGAIENNGEDIRNTSIEERFVRNQMYRGDTLVSRTTENRIYNAESNTAQTTNKWVVGIEYYGWKNNSDARHRLYVQLIDYDQTSDNESENSREQLDENPSTGESSLSETWQSQTKQAISYDAPVMFSYDGYKNFATDWFGQDYVFVNLEAVYGFGEQELRGEREEMGRMVQNGTIRNETLDSFETSFDNPNSKFMGGRLRTGYVITMQQNDFTLISGLTPYYEWIYEKNQQLEMLDKQFFDINKHQAGAEIPLFGSFDITNSFSIWGGSTVRFSHEYTLTDMEVHPFIEAPESGNPIMQNSIDTKRSELNQSLYLGFRFIHTSGFGLIANSRGNISNFNNWALTLRFRY